MKSKSKKSYKSGCPYGYIRRKSYTAVRKSGKKYYVASKCIKEKGRKGVSRGGSRKYKVIKSVKQGALMKYDYSMELPKTMRRKALKKAVEKEGSGTIIKRLNAIYVWNKTANPEIAKKAKEDENYVRTI